MRSCLRYGVIFLALAMVSASMSAGRGLARLGLAHWPLQLPVIYIGGAVFTGVMLGLFKPLTASLGGAMIVGALVVFTIAFALSPISIPAESWPLKLAASGIVGVIGGPAYAWAFWIRPRRKKDKNVRKA